MKKRECILCHGKGEIEEPKNWPEQRSEVELKRNAAILLKKGGYSIRQIMRLLNYKSIASIQKFLE